MNEEERTRKALDWAKVNIKNKKTRSFVALCFNDGFHNGVSAILDRVNDIKNGLECAPGGKYKPSPNDEECECLEGLVNHVRKV